MASEHKIDHIKKGGVVYPFVDQTARDNIQSLAQRVANYNTAQTAAVAAEETRAKAKEQALEDGKVTKVAGKGLSTNDFTDTYKDKLDNPAAMTGATAATGGKQGDVPAPLKAEVGKFLRGDGTWATPQDTTYEKVTHSADGLMSKEDKIKLDAMDAEADDLSACDTEFSGNVITMTFGNGRTREVTFNNDGTITEVITKADTDTITLNTTFNNDGSITRTKTVTPLS